MTRRIPTRVLAIVALVAASARDGSPPPDRSPGAAKEKSPSACGTKALPDPATNYVLDMSLVETASQRPAARRTMT